MGLKQQVGERVLATTLRAVVQAGMEENIPPVAVAELLFAELTSVIATGGQKCRQAAAAMVIQLEALAHGYETSRN